MTVQTGRIECFRGFYVSRSEYSVPLYTLHQS